MKNNKDAERFLKSRNIKSQYFDHYKAKVNSSLLYEGSSGIDVFSRLFDARILTLTGEVDDFICELLKAQLLYLETTSDEDITLYINSPGGNVYAGLGLLDVMDLVKPDVATVNTGLAASMGAVILCSGAKGKRKALKRSRTMIHQPMAGFSDYSQASDMAIEVKEINSLKKELYEIISTSSGQTYDKIDKDSDRDYWMNAIEAKKYGLIDEIIKKNGR